MKKVASIFSLIILVIAVYNLRTVKAFVTTDCTNTVATGIVQSDCEALDALYTDLNGVAWTDNTNWDTASLVNTWTGVTVIGDRVTGLDLDNNNLDGGLPEELADLTALETLDLGENMGLTGEIPSDLGDLVSLTELRLDNCALTGEIPTSIETLDLVTLFDVSRNNLTGNIPTEFSDMDLLEEIYIQRNQLDGSIPVAVASIPTLTNFVATTNNLTGNLPEEFSLATNLVRISVHSNELDGSIPSALTGLSSLQVLQFHSNNFSGEFPDFSGIGSLFYIDLFGNQFDFSDLEPNFVANNGIGTFSYFPQQSVDSVRTEVFVDGGLLEITPELPLNPSGNDSYQWYLGGGAIPGPEGTARVYSKTAAFADAGDYTYEVTNSVVGGFELDSHEVPDVITVSVLPPNNAPTGLLVDGQLELELRENQASTILGTMTTDDVDVTDTHTYSFCTANDNDSFSIVGDSLIAGPQFDYENPQDENEDNIYELCVRTTDSGFGNLFYDGTILVSITNVTESGSSSSRSGGGGGFISVDDSNDEEVEAESSDDVEVLLDEVRDSLIEDLESCLVLEGDVEGMNDFQKLSMIKVKETGENLLTDEMKETLIKSRFVSRLEALELVLVSHCLDIEDKSSSENTVGGDLMNDFKDAAEFSQKAARVIFTGNFYEIVFGNDDGNFLPREDLNIAEFLVMLDRARQYVSDTEYEVPEETPYSFDLWYYVGIGRMIAEEVVSLPALLNGSLSDGVTSEMFSRYLLRTLDQRGVI